MKKIALRVVALVALFTVVTPTIAFADTCWNECTIATTNWMNETGATMEEAQVYFQGCLVGCGMN